MKVAFPFYNLDMSYNICKRLRNEFKNDKQKASLAEALKCSYDKIYELLVEEKNEYINISKCLQKEDIKYSNIETNFEYLQQFEACPFIKVVRSQKMKIKAKGRRTNEVDTKMYEKYMTVMDKVEAAVNSMTVESENNNDAEKIDSFK